MQLQSYTKFNVNHHFLHYTYHVLRHRNLNTIYLNLNYIFYKIRTSVYTFDIPNRNYNSKLRRINQISHSIPKSNFDRIQLRYSVSFCIMLPLYSPVSFLCLKLISVTKRKITPFLRRSPHVFRFKQMDKTRDDVVKKRKGGKNV